METTIPKNIYAMTDEYSAQASHPVLSAEREAVSRLIYELVRLLMNNGCTPHHLAELATENGVAPERARDVSRFLSSWGLDNE